jgi:hypothetical protein
LQSIGFHWRRSSTKKGKINQFIKAVAFAIASFCSVHSFGGRLLRS